MTRPRRRYPRPHQPSYGAAHRAIRRQRGHPEALTCVGCGGPADHWSYDGDDPRELTDRDTDCRYSLDPGRYSPRCASCHRSHDVAQRQEPLDPLFMLWLYECGCTVTALASRYRRAPESISALLQTYGVHIRTPNQTTRWVQTRHGELDSAPPGYPDWLNTPTINNATHPTPLHIPKDDTQTDDHDLAAHEATTEPTHKTNNQSKTNSTEQPQGQQQQINYVHSRGHTPTHHDPMVINTARRRGGGRGQR